MKIDLSLANLKKYAWVVVLVPYLGLASYAEGLRPVFYFQLQNAACASIVVGYVNAKRDNDQVMIDYWLRLAKEYKCALPPV